MDVNGKCTLREAIQAPYMDTSVDACQVGDGDDKIEFPGGAYVLGLYGKREDGNATGDPDIKNNWYIKGANADITIIEGDLINRVLEIYGGNIPTHGLRAGSPAIDSANDFDCPIVDSRGVTRSIDENEEGAGTCDIDAYEYDGTSHYFVYCGQW